MSIPTEYCTKISELMKKKVGPVPRGVSLEREIINFTIEKNLKKLKFTFWAESLLLFF